MASLSDKVRKARNAATDIESHIAATKTVGRNAKTAGVKLSMAEERAAVKTLQPRISQDRKKTAARGAAIEKMQAKKAAAKRAAAAIGYSETKKAKPSTKKSGKK